LEIVNLKASDCCFTPPGAWVVLDQAVSVVLGQVDILNSGKMMPGLTPIIFGLMFIFVGIRRLRIKSNP
ncbi:hypothetical protein, partial [Arthrobacter alkaliphilus]